MKTAATRRGSCRVRRLDTRHGNRCHDDRGKGARIQPRPYGISQCVENRRARTRGEFRKNPLCFPGRVEGNLGPSPLCNNLASNSEHKPGTRDQKSWRGKPRQDLRRSGQSRSLPHAGFHVATYFPTRYVESTLSRFRGTSSEADTARHEYSWIYIFHSDVAFRNFRYD